MGISVYPLVLGHYENNAPLARLTPDATDPGTAMLGYNLWVRYHKKLQNYRVTLATTRQPTTCSALQLLQHGVDCRQRLRDCFWDLPSAANSWPYVDTTSIRYLAVVCATILTWLDSLLPSGNIVLFDNLLLLLCVCVWVSGHGAWQLTQFAASYLCLSKTQQCFTIISLSAQRSRWW